MDGALPLIERVAQLEKKLDDAFGRIAELQVRLDTANGRLMQIDGSEEPPLPTARAGERTRFPAPTPRRPSAMKPRPLSARGRSGWERFGSALGTAAAQPIRKRVIVGWLLVGFAAGTYAGWSLARRNTVPVEQLVSSEADYREAQALRQADARTHAGAAVVLEHRIEMLAVDLERALAVPPPELLPAPEPEVRVVEVEAAEAPELRLMVRGLQIENRQLRAAVLSRDEALGRRRAIGIALRNSLEANIQLAAERFAETEALRAQLEAAEVRIDEYRKARWTRLPFALGVGVMRVDGDTRWGFAGVLDLTRAARLF